MILKIGPGRVPYWVDVDLEKLLQFHAQQMAVEVSRDYLYDPTSLERHKDRKFGLDGKVYTVRLTFSEDPQ